jgi:23S rRNA (cytosine1962-C5)-methyltransferase
VIPCVLFEDEHLLAVDKPAGLNTHAPSPFAGEGIYDWLRHREPRWATLAIIHRLDKETSGVMVFGKTPLANRSLTEQFTAREVHKKYLLLTDRPVKRGEFTVKSSLVRVGEKYASVVGQASRLSGLTPKRTGRTPAPPGGELAETHFRLLESGAGRTLVAVEPRTGRTHQIRVHAAESGFPILGDTLYGGTAAERVFLHAAELHFKHPATGAACVFRSGLLPAKTDLPNFVAYATKFGSRILAMIDPAETNAFRLIHGAADGWPGWHVERLGDFLLSQAEHPLTTAQQATLAGLLERTGARGAYHKLLNRQVRRTAASEASPQLALGEVAPERFEIRESGVRFELSFGEGYSVGLFLDQRDNRRRFLTRHVAAGFALFGVPALAGPMSAADWPRGPAKAGTPNGCLELLNCFAYTCGFSVCAALGGARVTSLDLSKKYLEWGKRNFALNGLDPAQHDFIFGDTFDWLRRLAKKGHAFDVIVLDPPTFSQSKESGVFRAERDYGKLVTAALPVLKPDGVLFASTNAAEWPPEEFAETVKGAVTAARRSTKQEHYVPQPPDFPITRAEPGYLKTLWLRVS